MPYLEKVKTTVHLGENRPEEVELGAKTLFVGPTGSGKTRIVTSIALLLTGSADDVLGRDEVGSAGDLVQLAPPDRDLEVHGWWTDKALAGLKVGRKPGGEGTTNKQYNGGPTNGHEWAHPVRKVGELLAKSPAEARKAFLPFIVGDVQGVIGRVLPTQYTADPRAPAIDSVDTLVRALELAKKRSKEEHDRVKANDELSDQLANAALPLPADQDQQMAREAEEAARTRLEQLRGARNAAQAHGQQVAEYTKLAIEYKGLEEQLAALAAVQRSATADHLPLFAAASVVLSEATKLGLDKCPMCLSAVGAPHLVARKERIEGLVSTTKVESKAWSDAQAQIKGIQARMAQIQARAEVLAQTIPQEASVVVPDEELVAAEQLYQGARAVSAQTQGIRGQWETIQRAREAVAHARNEAAWWEGFHTELERVRDRLLGEGRAAFEGQIAQWLPKGLGCRVMLQTPEGRETFRLALVREGMTTLSPSGGQRAALLLATAIACLGHLPEIVQQYAVVMLDEERGMDPGFLAEVMRALKNAPFQVVLTSLHRPHRKTMAGWAVTELEAPPRKPTEAELADGSEDGKGGEDGKGKSVAEA